MPSMELFCEQANVSGVSVVAVTTTPKAFEREQRLLSRFANIRVALGLHPQLVGERLAELELVIDLIDSTRYIGEIGLDFNRDYYRTKEEQLKVFIRVIECCMHFQNKVISIHSVRSDKVVLDILESCNCCAVNYCILHWYSGSLKQLSRAIEIGCYFSINKNMLLSENGRRIIEQIPSERILLETDAPFTSEFVTGQQQKKIMDYCINELIELKSVDVAGLIISTSKSIFI